MSRRLIVVSNRLPLTIEHTDSGFHTRPSSGGLVSAVNAYLNTRGNDTFTDKVWLGVPGCSENVWDSLDEGEKSSAYQYLPVFIEERTYEQYYNGFSNSVIWPLFHYFPSYADYNSSFFESYIDANRQFCELLMKNIRPNDVIWIHDYHLLPLAGMLRERIPGLTIGFFLHIPFPSFELFRVIPKQWQSEILKGMLGADLIGFHTADYVKHFLKTAEISLNVERDGQYLDWANRTIKVDAFPISIDFELFDGALSKPDVEAQRKQYLEIKGSRKMIFSVDRLDYTKGIYNRLQGFEQFLQQNPGYKGNVIFVLVVVPSRDTIDKYSEKKKIIDEYIGSINSTLGDIGWQPTIYQYGHLDFNELLALYTSCDLALITPLRDGMNLVAKEFVASRSDLQGVLVLSELAGAAAELTDALLINPNDTNEIAEKIRKGLEMPQEEQKTRMQQMRQRIKTYDVRTWALDYFEEMEAVKAKQLKFEVAFMDSFSKSMLLESYANAKKSLMLIDYDGTLVPFSPEPNMALPDAALLKRLQQLAQLEKNELVIISGRDSETLEKWLGSLNIALVAEHGAKVRNVQGRWEKKIGNEPGTWKEKITATMERYVAKCPSSFIEHKEHSLAWHYRKSDTFLSKRKATELHEELLACSIGLPLDVIDGNKVIEVRNKGIHKGKAVEAILASHEYDFILCIGDDRTDEDMFAVLATIPHAYTIKVGQQASFAKYNLHTPYLVLELLEAICQLSEKHPIA